MSIYNSYNKIMYVNFKWLLNFNFKSKIFFKKKAAGAFDSSGRFLIGGWFLLQDDVVEEGVGRVGGPVVVVADQAQAVGVAAGERCARLHPSA